MKQERRDTDPTQEPGKQRPPPKSGEAMNEYTQQYVANAAMRNAVDLHARQNASEETDAADPDKNIRPNSYRIVKSFLGIRDEN